MLHELAHLALTPWPYAGHPVQKADGRSGEQFAAEHGLAWSDPAAPWQQQAGEVAAEALAWGLMDEPDQVDSRMGRPTCAALARDFTALTHTTPDPRACPVTKPAAGPSGGAP
jgi:ATP-dependent DNA ligase